MAEKKGEKFMKFGPVWLHNLSQETNSVPVMNQSTSSGTPTSAVAAAATTNAMATAAVNKEPTKNTSLKNRYGREEMLALFDGNASQPKDVKPDLKELLFNKKVQLPIALQAQNTGEVSSRKSWPATRNTNPRMLNPEMELNTAGGRTKFHVPRRGVFYTPEHASYSRNAQFHNGPGIRSASRAPEYFDIQGSRNVGRNGSVLEPEEWELPPHTRPQLPAHAGRWGNDANWRRTYPKGPEDEDGWRGGSGENPRARPHYLGKKLSWREDEAEKDFRFERERGFPDREWTGEKRERGPAPWLSNRKSWVGDSHSPEDHLPEWYVRKLSSRVAQSENAFGPSGTFDSSGAFHGGADDGELEGPKHNTLTHSQSSTAPFSADKKAFLSRGHTQGNIQLHRNKVIGGAPGLRGPLLRTSSEDFSATNYKNDFKSFRDTFEKFLQGKYEELEDEKDGSKSEAQNKEPQKLSEVKSNVRASDKNQTPRPASPESFDDVMSITDRTQKESTVVEQKIAKKMEAIVSKSPLSVNPPVKTDTSQPPPSLPVNPSNAAVFTEYPMIKDIVKMFVLEEEEASEKETTSTASGINRTFKQEQTQLPPLTSVNPPETPPSVPPGAKLPEPGNAFCPEPLPESRYRSTETWYYRDPQGEVQGPFTSVEMTEWFETGYFSDNLCIRKGDDNFYITLGFLKSMCRGSPFNLGSDATDLVFKVAESISNYRNKRSGMSPEENALYDARQITFTSAQEKLYKESQQKDYMMKQQLLYEQQAHAANIQQTPMNVMDSSQIPIDMQYIQHPQQHLPPGVEHQHINIHDLALPEEGTKMETQWLNNNPSAYTWRGPAQQSNSPSPVQFQMAASHLNQLQIQAMVGSAHTAMMGNMNPMPLLRAGPPMMQPPILLPPVSSVTPIPSSIWENQVETKQPILLEQLYSSINQQHPSTIIHNQNHNAMMMELVKSNQYKTMVEDANKQHAQLQTQHPLMPHVHPPMPSTNLLPNTMQQNTIQMQQMMLSQQPPNQKSVIPIIDQTLTMPETSKLPPNLKQIQLAQRPTQKPQIAKPVPEPVNQKEAHSQPKTKPINTDSTEVKSASVKVNQNNVKLAEVPATLPTPTAAAKTKRPDEKQKKKDEARGGKEQKENAYRMRKQEQTAKPTAETNVKTEPEKTKKKKEEKVKVEPVVAEPAKKKKAQAKETQEKVETPKKGPSFPTYPKESVPQQKNALRAAPWCPKDVQTEVTSSLSLTEIQKLEREQKSQQTRDLVMLLAEQQAAATAKELKESNKQSAFTWADQKRKQPSMVMNLTDIQAEEQLQLSISHKQAEKDNSTTAAAVAAAGLASSQSNPNIWGLPVASVPWWQSPNTGFWDTPSSDVKEPTAKKTTVEAAANLNNKPQTSGNARTTKIDTKVVEQKPTASKKVTPKAAPQPSKAANSEASEEFLSWAKLTVTKMDTDIDVATFVGFLMNVEAPDEIKEYIKYYLGEGKDATEFARQFIEKRSRILRLNTTSVPSDDLCVPAPAVNPSMGSMDFQDAKFKKTKKNKMLKIDSRNLGFNVTAAADRFNIGDIHSV